MARRLVTACVLWLVVGNGLAAAAKGPDTPAAVLAELRELVEAATESLGEAVSADAAAHACIGYGWALARLAERGAAVTNGDGVPVFPAGYAGAPLREYPGLAEAASNLEWCVRRSLVRWGDDRNFLVNLDDMVRTAAARLDLGSLATNPPPACRASAVRVRDAAGRVLARLMARLRMTVDASAAQRVLLDAAAGFEGLHREAWALGRLFPEIWERMSGGSRWFPLGYGKAQRDAILELRERFPGHAALLAACERLEAAIDRLAFPPQE